MLNLIAVFHIILAVTLIVLVLVQDSKGGGALGIGGGSNSLLGATGATTLAGKMTRIVAGLLALTCLYLTFEASRNSRSVLDSTTANAQVPPLTPAPPPLTPGQGPATNTAQPPTPPPNSGPAVPPNNNGIAAPTQVNTGGQPATTTTTSGLTTTTTTVPR